MIVVFVITVCVVLLAKALLFRQKHLQAFASLPGPKGLPVLGNAVEMMLCDSQELHDKFVLWVNQWGPRVRMDLCSQFWIMLSSPEDIEKIVTDNAFNRKSHDYDYLMEWLGNGILLDYGPSWHVNRKALTDAFHFKVLENFLPIYQEQSEILVDKLLASGSAVVDIFRILKLFTLDVVLETAMGARCNAQHNDSEYVRAVAGLTHIVNWRMYSVIGQSELTFRFSKYYRQYREMLAVSNDFTMDLIKRRRKENVDENNISEKGIKRLALLDKLLHMEIEGRKLSDEEIRSQVNNFMFAGHDTSSSALTFTLYLLAKNPDCQEKLYEEIKMVLGNNHKITFSQSILNDLKYMDQVIKETLRLFPSVPYISRTVDKDTELAGIRYPAGTAIMLGIFYMHRNPMYFSEPTRFMPERFDIDGKKDHKSPYVYIPFSAGGRNCIGQKFAMNAMKIALSHIILRCRVELEDPNFEPRLKDELIVKPADGMPVRFLPRG